MKRQHSTHVQPARLVVQLLFLGLATTMAILHQVMGGGPTGAPSIDALCPFGGLETLYKFFTTGEFIQRLYYSDFILLGGTLLLAFVVGRYFCGWICALGTLQELARKLGRKLFPKLRIELPAWLDKPARYLKYVVLIGTLYLTWKAGTLIIRPYDPWAAYAHSFGDWSELWTEFTIGISILLASLGLGLFVDRVFCRYLCPLGGFLGGASKLGAFSIRRDTNACLNCNKCEAACPVNIPIKSVAVIKDAECIGCLTCSTTCPTGKIGTEHEGQTFLLPAIAGHRLRPAVVGAIGLALFVGTLAITNLAGMWQTSPGTLVEAVSEGGRPDPANIRGYMTLGEIARTYQIDPDQLYRELGFSEQQVPLDTKSKDIRTKLGVSEAEFDTQKVRDAVAKLQPQ